MHFVTLLLLIGNLRTGMILNTGSTADSYKELINIRLEDVQLGRSGQKVWRLGIPKSRRQKTRR